MKSCRFVTFMAQLIWIWTLWICGEERKIKLCNLILSKRIQGNIFNWQPWNTFILVSLYPLEGTNNEAVEFLWFVALSARIMNHPTKKRSCQSAALLLRWLYLRQTAHHSPSCHLFRVVLWLGKRYPDGSDSYFLFSLAVYASRQLYYEYNSSFRACQINKAY